MLESQVAAFEPHMALFAGPTGLEIYQQLIPRAAAALVAGGSLLLEFGFGQRSSIELLLAASDWEHPEIVCDLQGIPRIVHAQKPAAKQL